MEALASLPLVLAVVLVEFAVGGAFLLWFLDRGGQAPGGFLKLVALVDAAAIAFAAALVPALPGTELARRASLEPGPIAAFGQGVALVVLLVVLQLVTVFLPYRRLRDLVGVGVLVAGGTALVVAAVARPTSNPYDVLALLALPLGALALGGSSAAMLLGHWYLITPKLSSSPLRRAALVVVAAVVLQALVVAASIWRGDLAGITQTALWVAVALRVAVGLLLTFAVALGAWWTARLNTQSSTGLLYVGLGTVIVGEISARVVFFLTGAAI